MNEKDLHLLSRAVDFAAKAHAEQRRKDDQKTPYINHCIGVMQILASEGVESVETLCAAVLHDVVEDTSVSLIDVEELFPGKISDIVRAVTDNKKIKSKALIKIKQLERIPKSSLAAQQVKIADKYYNMTDLVRCVPRGWSVKKTQGYFVWSKKMVDQIINTALPSMVEKFNHLFNQSFSIEGKKYPVLPKNVDLDKFLQEYYKLLDKK